MWQDADGQYPIGFVPSRVVEELSKVPASVRGSMARNDEQRTLLMLQEQSTEQERSHKMARLTSFWRERGTFKLLDGWRDELWPVYGRQGMLLFNMERTAMGLLGTMRYGVHMVAFVDAPNAPYGIKLWIPKRAANKSTFPGMLDNTVAGGLMTGEDPFECIIREADEEASIPAEIVRRHAAYVDTVTYIYITEEKHVGESGFVYPECQWVYDLKLPADVVPRPKDGEVEEFRLCDVNQVRKDLREGKYKPNCAMVVINFFIRHRILVESNEPDIAAIKQRMHRDIDLPGLHQNRWRGS